MTGKSRLTVRKRLDGLVFEDGGKDGKLYDSVAALERIYLGPIGENVGAHVTASEASRLLTIARREQIDLEMEVTRKERWPKDIVEAVLDRSNSNVAGLLKAHRGKPLDDSLINDIFAELRGMVVEIKERDG